MAVLLGAASFGTGMLPLSVAFSKSSLSALSAFGTGLLLGAALGVVIPEGIETLASSRAAEAFPTSTIALSLIAGFTFMLIVERTVSDHSPSHDAVEPSQQPKPDEAESTVEFDVELGELERAEGISPDGPSRPYALQRTTVVSETRQRAFPLTLGLVVHALADGLALGSASLSESATEPSSGGSIVPTGLSVIVFLALVVHKAPTALALTTSLLSTSLPHAQCRKHLAIFSAATPLGTLLSYWLLSFFGADSHGRWPGIALLFSGGSFLYVATVLQPSLAHTHTSGSGDTGGSSRGRLLLTIGGMLTPYCIAALLGDDHGH
ncbi:Zinc/iron permease [Trametes coccinea BRFM310]|uniref:Zinc/iron permease n=1 Tax=Trametes coccinea (strain BRFM310) TaxID=1353009 RepID=A0A1Y2J464_TRAC3|nr:Zinc/iron permease [Trametes coccinea BRFM310]